MGNLLRMTPEQHKDADKPVSAKGDGQRRRREREKTANEASRDV